MNINIIVVVISTNLSEYVLDERGADGKVETPFSTCFFLSFFLAGYRPTYNAVDIARLLNSERLLDYHMHAHSHTQKKGRKQMKI